MTAAGEVKINNMQSETEISPSERYLICNYSFTDLTIDKIKRDIKHFGTTRSKDECYWQFMNWHKKCNEIAVLTIYAYADISLPKKFDTIFDIEHPANFLNIGFLVTQVVFNGWTPFNQISHGHKHVTIIQFDEAVPHIFNFLPVFGDETPKANSLQLGFCNEADYMAIRNKLLAKMSK